MLDNIIERIIEALPITIGLVVAALFFLGLGEALG